MSRALIFFFAVCFYMPAWALTGEAPVACAPLLAGSRAMQGLPFKRLEEIAYLKLLDLTLEGIDEIDHHAFGHGDGMQIKTELLNRLASSKTPINPLTPVHPGTSRNFTNFSPKLSTLADSGQFDLITENLTDEAWREIRKAVHQKLNELQNLQTAQSIAVPATKRDFVDQPDLNGDLQIHRLLRTGTLEEIYDFLTHAPVTPRYLNTPNNKNELPLEIFTRRFIEEQKNIGDLMRAKGALFEIELKELDMTFSFALASNDLRLTYETYAKGARIQLPLFKAAEIGNTASLETLVKLGASIHEVNSQGDGLLHVAIRNLAKNNAQKLKETVLLLIDYGADLKKRGWLGHTPFLLGVQEGCIELLDILLAEPNDIHVVSDNQYSAMHLAASNGSPVLIKFLYDRGANLNLPNTFGRTPFHIAARSNHLHALRMLYDLGAEIDVPDYDGITSKQYAYKPKTRDLIRSMLWKDKLKKLRGAKRTLTKNPKEGP